MLVERNQTTKRFNLTAVMISCRGMRANGKPVPPYAKWELSDDASRWTGVAIEAADIGKEANLMTIYQMDGMPEIVTADYREKNRECGTYPDDNCRVVQHKSRGC